MSLNEGQRRRALVYDMLLDAAGTCNHRAVTLAIIVNAAKLSFSEVDEFYVDEASSKLKKYAPTLRGLRAVGNLRREGFCG